MVCNTQNNIHILSFIGVLGLKISSFYCYKITMALLSYRFLIVVQLTNEVMHCGEHSVSLSDFLVQERNLYHPLLLT